LPERGPAGCHSQRCLLLASQEPTMRRAAETAAAPAPASRMGAMDAQTPRRRPASPLPRPPRRAAPRWPKPSERGRVGKSRPSTTGPAGAGVDELVTQRCQPPAVIASPRRGRRPKPTESGRRRPSRIPKDPLLPPSWPEGQSEQGPPAHPKVARLNLSAVAADVRRCASRRMRLPGRKIGSHAWAR